MNIPLEPNKPLEGVASPAEVPAPRKQYVPRALTPRRLWAIIRTLVMIRKDVPPLTIAQSIAPQVRWPQRIVTLRGHSWGVGGKLVGFPGSGVFHGKTNIAKSVTYRAVPNLDFNTERNIRRQERANAGS
jgi:hypothetical protein